jgi:hypothetical protein
MVTLILLMIETIEDEYAKEVRTVLRAICRKFTEASGLAGKLIRWVFHVFPIA